MVAMGCARAHDVTRREAEGDLRHDEPDPVDAGVQDRIDRRPSRPRARPSTGAARRDRPRACDGAAASGGSRRRAGRPGSRSAPCATMPMIRAVRLNARSSAIAGLRHPGHRHRGEQVDRVPEAPLHDEAVGERDDRHRGASDEPSLDAGRDRLHLDRDPHAMARLARARAARPRRDGDDRPRSLGEGTERHVLDAAARAGPAATSRSPAVSVRTTPTDGHDHVRDEAGERPG